MAAVHTKSPGFLPPTSSKTRALYTASADPQSSTPRPTHLAIDMTRWSPTRRARYHAIDVDHSSSPNCSQYELVKLKNEQHDAGEHVFALRHTQRELMAPSPRHARIAHLNHITCVIHLARLTRVAISATAHLARVAYLARVALCSHTARDRVAHFFRIVHIAVFAHLARVTRITHWSFRACRLKYKWHSTYAQTSLFDSRLRVAGLPFIHPPLLTQPPRPRGPPTRVTYFAHTVTSAMSFISLVAHTSPVLRDTSAFRPRVARTHIAHTRVIHVAMSPTCLVSNEELLKI
ncbi:uncharacterized protein BXZ73DRAFT_109396 [Epithele typhae]|uniref:uncharacterized protein n=1 Tax=Epithele typhae TaxID=378194 RepID=UPI002007548F|nr:uncharacterized protein BXZ73DRAFT_109396 [Epithele typhae]KAH9910191.1 hypothetical protein BXZ73DRAFT_109396 [Epithele typhae]